MNLALGTAQLGMHYGIANVQGQPSFQTAFDILNMAVHNNFRWLDTASNYGSSEAIIGRHCSQYEHPPYRIITKIPAIMTHVKNEREAGLHIRTYVENSLRELAPARPDVLLLHNENDYECFAQIIDASFIEIRECESIEHFGISLYKVEKLLELQEHSLLDTFQVPCNIFDHRYLQLLMDGKIDSSTGIFIRSVYLQGLFFANSEAVARHVPKAIPFLSKLNELVDEFNITLAEACLGFIKYHIRSKDQVLIGAENPEQVQNNASIWKRCCLSEDFIARTRNLFSTVPIELINPSLWEKKS